MHSGFRQEAGRQGVASDDFDQKGDIISLPFLTMFLFTCFSEMLGLSSKLLKYRIDVLPVLCVLILELGYLLIYSDLLKLPGLRF